MKIKSVKEETKSLDYLIMAYDVSKHKHNYYTAFSVGRESKESEDEIPNKTKSIIKHFTDVRELADSNGFRGVIVVCEPTGGYEKVLLRIAKTFGFFINYVNGEATSKAKVIESNDSGKNDIKDARVIHMLAKMGATLSCNIRADEYGELKYHNAQYEDCSRDGARMKNRVNHLRECLFPDLGITSSQLYSKVVACVVDKYSLNPYLISEESYEDFRRSIEELYPRKMMASSLELLKRIWSDSQLSKLLILPKDETDAMAIDLKYYYDLRTSNDTRKEQIKGIMTTLIEGLDEWNSLKDTPASSFLISRIVAETGPWNGFPGIKQLLRFGGLNLKEKTSGTFKGHVKLSKKGNALLRKVLGQLCFTTFLKKGSLYADYYKQKKEDVNGFYGLTCVMRKVLKMLFGIVKSQTIYNVDRVFSQKVEREEIAA